MRISCQHCRKELNIPDDKLPASPKFKVRCPSCKNEIIVDKTQQPTQANPGVELNTDVFAPGVVETGPQGVRPAAPKIDLETVEPDIFPPGAKVVLMFLKDEHWREAARNYFEESAFHESLAQSPTEAIIKLRVNEYNVMLIDDSPENQTVLDEITAWPGIRRRSLNLILFGNRAASLDPRIAFQKSTNFYLNYNDADKAPQLLEGCLRGYEIYHRLFFMARAEDEASKSELEKKAVKGH